MFRVFAVPFAILVLSVASSVMAHSAQVGDIQIHHPWAPVSLPGAKAGAIFMTLENKGDQPDKLISASTPVAGKAELHTHINDNGVMRMRAVPAIEIPAKSSVELKHGGLHVMLFDLKAPLEDNDSVTLTLVFERAGVVTVEAYVEPIGKAKHSKELHH